MVFCSLRLLAKRAELEAQGRDLSQLDEKIAVSATVLKEDWAREGKELWETHRLGDLSLVRLLSLLITLLLPLSY